MEQALEITELNRRFGIPQIVKIVAGQGGLTKVEVTSPAARGEVYLHGAHVTSWKPSDAEEVLFVSSQSQWNDTRPIRGGVPVCFPWFSNKVDDVNAPMHGFARTTAWKLESVKQTGDAVTVSMFIESDDATRKWWPADFRAVLRATFGPAPEMICIETCNVGDSFVELTPGQHHQMQAIVRISNLKPNV